jgi:predicted nucleic acid-binding protein
VSVFIDTSAILAFLDGDDRHHEHAAGAWSRALRDREDVLTTNYVVLETHAVVQRRFGLDAVRRVVEELIPALRIRWVDADIHARAVDALLTARRRALVYDPDFEEQGFESYGPA